MHCEKDATETRRTDASRKRRPSPDATDPPTPRRQFDAERPEYMFTRRTAIICSETFDDHWFQVERGDDAYRLKIPAFEGRGALSKMTCGRRSAVVPAEEAHAVETHRS